MNKIYEFIKELRESDERTKRRWLFLVSGVSMAVIVFFWIKYFALLVGPASQPQPEEQNSGQSFAFWETFKAGLGMISENAGKTLNSIMNTVRQPKSYDIVPQ